MSKSLRVMPDFNGLIEAIGTSVMLERDKKCDGE